eukprot:6492741-Amphidinium_carterae.2
MTPLHRSGPCAGFQSLQIVHGLYELAMKFRTCRDADAVKAVQAEALVVRKQLTCLQAACKAANTELTSARTRALAAAEARAKKEAKKKNLQPETKAEPKRKALKTAVQKHVAFTFEPPGGRKQVETATAWSESWALDSPFVVSRFLYGQTTDVAGLAEEFLEFGKIFNESSFKVVERGNSFNEACSLGNLVQEVTDGRAARACPNSAASSGFRNRIMEAMPESIRELCISEMNASSTCLDVAALSKACIGAETILAQSSDILVSSHMHEALATQTYGLAAGHTDSAVTELGWMSCVRWTFQGTRSLVLVSLVAVQRHVQSKVGKLISLSDCVEWGRKVSAAEWSEFLVSWGKTLGIVCLVASLRVGANSVSKASTEKEVQYCTIGPYDLLWVPVGWMYFHDVMQAEDVLGMRQVILTRSALDMHKKSSGSCRCSWTEVATDSVAIKFHEWHDAVLSWFAEQERLRETPGVGASSIERSAGAEKELHLREAEEKKAAELQEARKEEEREAADRKEAELQEARKEEEREAAEKKEAELQEARKEEELQLREAEEKKEAVCRETHGQEGEEQKDSELPGAEDTEKTSEACAHEEAKQQSEKAKGAASADGAAPKKQQSQLSGQPRGKGAGRGSAPKRGRK